MAILLLSTGALLGAAPAGASTLNGSFEEDLRGWQPQGPAPGLSIVGPGAGGSAKALRVSGSEGPGSVGQSHAAYSTLQHTWLNFDARIDNGADRPNDNGVAVGGEASGGGTFTVVQLHFREGGASVAAWNQGALNTPRTFPLELDDGWHAFSVHLYRDHDVAQVLIDGELAFVFPGDAVESTGGWNGVFVGTPLGASPDVTFDNIDYGGANDGARPIEPVSPPLNVTALPGAAPGQVRLSWEPPAETYGRAVDGYDIYRGSSPEAMQPIAQTGGAGSHTDTTASMAGANYYRIRARTAGLQGSASAAACSVAGPWGPPLVPPVGTACPASDGWVEERVHSERRTLEPRSVDRQVIEVRGGQDPSDPLAYRVEVSVADGPPMAASVYTGGAQLPPVELDLVHERTPYAWASLDVSRRYPDVPRTCMLRLNDECVASTPVEPTPGQILGTASQAHLLVEFEAGVDDRLLVTQSIRLPFGGNVGS